jgi:RNA polymerase sigma-70 factor (ECF subfamily)
MDALDAFWEAARIATPELEGDREAFLAHVKGLRDDHDLPSVEHAAELGLAFACGRGRASAHRRLDPILVETAAQAVRRIDPSPAFADLVTQELRARMLVGAPPRILEYAGRGSLAGWLRTAATRVALNLRRGKAEGAREAIPSELPLPARAVDSEVFVARHRGHVEAAIRTAIRRLPPRERAILCLHVRDGLSSDRIAALYRVGRSTAKRWLVAAREQLSNETERELRGQLALSPSEYDGLVAGVRSEVDVSLVRLLEEE